MLLILDVEMVEYFLLLGLCNVGMGELTVKLLLPKLYLRVLLLDQPDQILILVDKMGVLC